MTSLDSVKIKARKVVRSRLANVAPSDTNATTLDRAAEDICAALDKSRAPKGIEAYLDGLTLVGTNIEALGAKSLKVLPEKLLTQDTSHLKALLEEDADERKITNDFAASEICGKCGLPKSNDKININRLDVEDEVFGKQFDYVYNDVCTCQLDDMLKSRLARKEGETEEQRVERMKREEEERKREAKKNPILALWEEQNEIAEEDAAAAVAAVEGGKQKSAVATLPERRDRE